MTTYSDKFKKGDRSIIISIYGKTKTEEIFWYKQDNLKNNYTESWKSSQKITNNKSLSFVIDKRTDVSNQSKLSIYLDYKIYLNNKLTKIESKIIKTISDNSLVLMLLKIVLKKQSIDVIDAVVGIIKNKQDPNKILIVKRHKYDNLIPDIWVLPGGKKDKSESIEDTLVREMREETGLILTEYDKIDYKDIFNIGNNVYMLNVYLINNYSGYLKDFPNEELEDFKWIDILNIKNNSVRKNFGKQILKVLDYYLDQVYDI